MSVEDYQVSFSLEVNVEEAYEEVRQLQMLLFRTLGLLRRLGLPPELDAAIMKIQRFITIVNQARLTMAAFQAASGPIGWGLALVGFTSTAVSMGDFILET